MALKRYYFLVHGKVQGVWFRAFTQEQANSLSITGWVRNTPNGKVEGEAQGSEENMTAFMMKLLQGPKLAHVVKLDKEERDVVEGEVGFEIRRGSH